MKRLFAIILAIVLCIPVGVSATDYRKDYDNEMDVTDIITSSYYYASSVMKNDKDDVVYISKIIPLYSVYEKIVAYYVTFSNDCYAVVHNSKNNPASIEFGEGKNNVVEGFIEENPNAKVVYNNPGSIYSLDYFNKLSNGKQLKQFYDYYPELLNENCELSTELKQYKNQIIEEGILHTTSNSYDDYGFIYISNMPSGSFTHDYIVGALSVDWAIMDDYNDIADNHCGATTVTNLALYFTARGKSNLKINNSKDDTFFHVHNIVGDGPKVAIANYAVTYFNYRGYSLSYASADTESAIITATTNDQPCGILLCDDLLSWHWVLGVGWRRYMQSNDFYIRINNNWDNTIYYYYKPNSGSTWISGTSYWVDD